MALAAAPLAVMSVSGRVHAEYEAAIFGVNDYGGSGKCPGGADLSHAVNDMNEVRGQLAGMGYRVSPTGNANGGTDGRDFIDTALGGSDQSDPYGTDWADVVFYSGHGYRVHNNNSSSYSAILMGDNEETCEPNTRSHLRFGSSNGDANLLILAACQSMQRSVWNDGAYWSAFSAAPFSMFFGFQGISYDSSDNTGRYGDFVAAAENNGLGSAWVDLLTDLDFFSSNQDQCATLMVAGSSAAQCDDQYDNAGFKDYHQPSSYAVSSYYYWCDCDADDADPLPGC